jgi:hypothetical protein
MEDRDSHRLQVVVCAFFSMYLFLGTIVKKLYGLVAALATTDAPHTSKIHSSQQRELDAADFVRNL